MVSLLQLSIEPCEQQDKPRNMTSSDWKRPALEILLKLYHEHPILYDMRHPKYYAKMERQKALNTIIDLLEDHRPGTTTGDILKKIQTMRTQFGQEYGKVRKAQSKGTEYHPTIWWYQHLSFLRKHVKPRAALKDELMDELQDQEEDYMSMSQNTDVEYENYTAEEAYELENSEIVYEIQSSPSGKGKQEICDSTEISLHAFKTPKGPKRKQKSIDNEILATRHRSMALPRRKLSTKSPIPTQLFPSGRSR